MKPYTVTLEVKTKWTMEVHAEDKQQAEETAEGLDYAQIETGGEFGEVVSIEATDTELLYPEDEEDEVGEAEPVEPERMELTGDDGSKVSGEKSPNPICGDRKPSKEEDKNDRTT